MRRYSLLYLDDDAGNLSVFEMQFLREYDVFTALTPQQARTVLAERRIDILVTDQRMPEMTGTDFLKSISHAYPELVKFIVTAYSDVEVVIKGINECGIFRYIPKPWVLAEFRQALSQAADIIRLREENHLLITDLRTTNERLSEAVEESQALNRKLTGYTLQLVHKGEHLKNLRDYLKAVQSQMNRAQDKISEALSNITADEKMDGRWDDFLVFFENVHQTFFSRLQERFPDLTASERKLCALIRMNLASKDIASIAGIAPHSVNVARHRLRKKLDLKEEERLEDVIMAL